MIEVDSGGEEMGLEGEVEEEGSEIVEASEEEEGLVIEAEEEVEVEEEWEPGVSQSDLLVLRQLPAGAIKKWRLIK